MKRINWQIGMYVSEWGTGMVDKVIDIDPHHCPPKWVKLRQRGGQEDIVVLEDHDWKVVPASEVNEQDYI